MSLLEEAEEALRELGIPEMPRPKNQPTPLADIDITILTNLELAGLHAQYVSYAVYMGEELAKIEAQEENTKRMVKDHAAMLKDQLTAAGKKGPEVMGAVLENEDYKALDLEHQKLFFMKSILKRRYSGFVKQAGTLSRNIELRKLEFEQTLRTSNIGKRPAPRGFGAGAAGAPPAKPALPGKTKG